MTSADIRNIKIAAAGLESADFARGWNIGAVAAAAEMTPGDIARAAGAPRDRAEAAEPA